MIRITAGILKGKSLKIPDSWPVRPTTALVREAIFNRLNDALIDCRFLDLFAGSGLMSFEAFSRGAKTLVAVDQAKPHCAQMIKAAQEWKVPIRITCQKVESFLARPRSEAFDVVFLDPPYAFDRWEALWPLLSHWVHADSWIIAEHEQPEIHPLAECRTYGNTRISWLTGDHLVC